MLKVRALSVEQKERLMQKLPALRSLHDNGIEAVGFAMAGSRLEIYVKRSGYDEPAFPITMYAGDPDFYDDVYQNQ